MIDLSGIHTCPNCNAKPRCTGQKVIGFGTTVGPQARPVKIRCSNKNCELSRHSVPTEFWQAINRNGAEELQKAYSQFEASLKSERQAKKEGRSELVLSVRELLDSLYHAEKTLFSDGAFGPNHSWYRVPIAIRQLQNVLSKPQ